MCEHRDFKADVQVDRTVDGDGKEPTRFAATVRVRCIECGIPFRFVEKDTTTVRIKIVPIES